MFVKTIAVTLCVIGVALAELSPVFLWGTTTGPVKASLQAVPQNDFEELVATLLKDRMVVAFVENGLNSNDFLCANAETSQSCYAHLQGVQTKTYYAAIENPIEAIRRATKDREYNSVNTLGQLANPLECSVGRSVIITFDDKPGQDRDVQLEAHDAAIDAITRSSKCPTVYMYLAAPSTSPAPKRSRRAVKAETDTTAAGKHFRDGSWFLIYYTTLNLYSGNTPTEIILDNMVLQNNTKDPANNFTATFTTADGKTLTFDIVYKTDGYVYMSNIVYDKVSYRVSGVNAPLSFSYHCGKLTVDCISPTEGAACTTSLEWNDLQFEAPFGSTINTTFVFSDSWDCVPFFSPGILMGLFVLIFLLIITFTGICWMMDINTMDRFDDPKGKTITINASE